MKLGSCQSSQGLLLCVCVCVCIRVLHLHPALVWVIGQVNILHILFTIKSHIGHSDVYDEDIHSCRVGNFYGLHVWHVLSYFIASDAQNMERMGDKLKALDLSLWCQGFIIPRILFTNNYPKWLVDTITQPVLQFVFLLLQVRECYLSVDEAAKSVLCYRILIWHAALDYFLQRYSAPN